MQSNWLLGPNNTMLLRALLVWTCWTTVALSFTASRQPPSSRWTLNDPRYSHRCSGPSIVRQTRLFGEKETEPNVARHEASFVNDASALSRRHWVQRVTGVAATSAAAVGIGWLTQPPVALASGGATAGRYTYVERMGVLIMVRSFRT
jgi:hypothetical protein